MTSEMFLNAQSVDISKQDDTEIEDTEQDDQIDGTNSDSKEDDTGVEEWQEDVEIDWEKGVDISEDTNWDAEDSDKKESD